MPKVRGVGDLPAVLSTVLELVGNGELTPGEGQIIASMIEEYRKGAVLAEIESRVAALERKGDVEKP